MFGDSQPFNNPCVAIDVPHASAESYLAHLIALLNDLIFQ